MQLKVESPVDARDELLIKSNRCNSFYAGAFGMEGGQKLNVKE